MENPPPPKKLRSACDTCHQAKMRCSGGQPCAGCLDLGHQCCYSVSNRAGRPKGTKNKRTLEAMKNQQQQQQQQQQQAQRNGDTEAEAPAKNASSIPQRSSTIYCNTTSDNLTSFENVFLDTTTADCQDLFSSLINSDTFWDSATCDFVEDTAPDNGQDIHVLSFKDSEAILQHQSSLHDGTAYINPSLSNDGENGLDKLNLPRLQAGKKVIESPESYPETDPMSLSPSSPSSESTCKCLQHHAYLLCRLKDLEHGHNKPSIDLVLVGVQQALEPWKRLIQCRVCHQTDDQEVLLLSAMSIRTVLRRVQSLFFESGYPQTSGCSPSDESGGGLKQQKASAGRQAFDSVRLTVGIYELTGEEQMLVTDLLLRNTLSKIEFALMCLKERLERCNSRRTSFKPSGNDSRSLSGQSQEQEECSHVVPEGAASEADHVQQILGGVESTLQALGRLLRNTNSPSLRQL